LTNKIKSAVADAGWMEATSCSGEIEPEVLRENAEFLIEIALARLF